MIKKHDAKKGPETKKVGVEKISGVAKSETKRKLGEKSDVKVPDLSPSQFLFMSVMAGDQAQAKVAIAAGADVNLTDPQRGVTPLILATIRGDLGMAKLLLENKADPNKGFKQPITESDKEMIRSFRKMREADPELLPQGDTLANEEAILLGKITEIEVSPLGIASRKRNAEMIELLKQYGAK